MLKLKNLLFGLSLIACTSMFGMNEDEQKQIPTRELAVFFTGLEAPDGTGGPCSIQATSALHQKASPIVISKNALYNTLTRERKKYKKDVFLYDEWIIKRIGKHFLLLIPKSYLSEKNITAQPSTEHITDDEAPTKLELELGLRIDHLEGISKKELYTEIEITLSLNIEHMANRVHIISKILPDEFKQSIYNSINETSNLFILNKEYSAYKKNIIPQWVIYWHGHGSPAGLIGELLLENFIVLLNFLDSKITTNFFTLFSCFAGKNLKLISKKTSQTFSFPITGTSLGGNCATIDSSPHYSLDYNFKKFFSTLHNAYTNYEINNGLNAVMHFKKNYNNIPLVKNRYDDSFKPIKDTHTLIIDTIMGSVRKNILDITSMSSDTKPTVILLNTNSIEFPLKLSSETKILSITEADCHTFKEIILTTEFSKYLTTPFKSLEYAFLSIFKEDSFNTKIFFIKKLTVHDKTFYNVIFTGSDAMYYCKNPDTYIANDNAYLEYLKHYKNQIDSYKDRCPANVAPDFIDKLENLYKKYPFFIPDEKCKNLLALKAWWNKLSKNKQTIIKLYALDKKSDIIVTDSYEFARQHSDDVKKYKHMCHLDYLKQQEDERIKKSFLGQHILLKSKL